MKRDKSMNPDNMEFLIFAKERFMGEGLNTLTYDRVGKKNAYEGLYAHIKVLLWNDSEALAFSCTLYHQKIKLVFN